MDVKKQPGCVMNHPVSPEDMDLINRLAKTTLAPEQVYTFAVRLCDNEVDRDWERFDISALSALSQLFVGKSGIFDHNWSAEGQTARIYRTELCQEPGLTAAGEPCRYLKGYAYMLRSDKNSDLIAEIEGGIKKEVSIGCSVSADRSAAPISGARPTTASSATSPSRTPPTPTSGVLWRYPHSGRPGSSKPLLRRRETAPCAVCWPTPLLVSGSWKLWKRRPAWAGPI